MSLDVRAIRPEDFIRTKADGSLNTEETQALLERTASEIKNTSIHRVLIDTRGATANFNPSQLYEIGKIVANDPELADARVAFLTRRERIDKARFMALVSNNRGAHGEAFVDFEDALDWLLMQGEPQAT